MSKRERTDGETDPNTRPAKRAKETKAKSENNANLFDTLHDELIRNILALLPIEQHGNFVVVCKHWHSQLLGQVFWREKVSMTWKSSIAEGLRTDESGSVKLNQRKLIVPTLKVGSKEVVDWRRYYKIRLMMNRAAKIIRLYYKDDGSSKSFDSSGITEYFYRVKLDDSSVSYDDSRILFVAWNDLLCDTVVNIFENLPQRQAFISSYENGEQMAKLLVRILFELGIEILPLVMEGKLFSKAKKIVEYLVKYTKGLNIKTNPRYTIKYYEASQVMRSLPKCCYELFSKSCRIFACIETWNATLEGLFINLLKQMLDFVPMFLNYDPSQDQSDEEDPAMRGSIKESADKNCRNLVQLTYDESQDLRRGMFSEFRYPVCEMKLKAIFFEPTQFIIDSSFYEVQQCNKLLADFIVETYNSTDDPAVQAMALALSDVSGFKSHYLATKLTPLACSATKHSHAGVALAGYVLLWNLSWQIGFQSEGIHKLQVFDLAIDTMIKYPSALFFAIYIVAALFSFGCDAEQVTDEKLDELNKAIFSCLKSEDPFAGFMSLDAIKERLHLRLWRLGASFKGRFKKYLPEYEAIIRRIAGPELRSAKTHLLEQPSVNSEEILLQYVRLGEECEGNEFEPKAKDFIRRVLQEKDNYQFRDSHFYAYFSDIVFDIYRDDKAMIKEVTTNMLQVFDRHKEVLEWGAYDNELEAEEFLTPWSFTQVKALRLGNYVDEQHERLDGWALFIESPLWPLSAALSETDMVLAKLEKTDFAEETIKEWCDRDEIVLSTKGLMKFRDIIPNECVQTVLHLALVHFRVKHSSNHLEAAYDLFMRLKDQLVPFHQEYYINIMAKVMKGINKEIVKREKHKFHQLFNKLVEEYFAIDRMSCCVAKWLLTFALRFDVVVKSTKYPSIAFIFYKRLVERSTLVARLVLNRDNLKILFEQEYDDSQRLMEKVDLIALLIYYFGHDFIEAMLLEIPPSSRILSGISEVKNRAVAHIRQHPNLDPGMKLRLTRFIVIEKLVEKDAKLGRLELGYAKYWPQEEHDNLMDLIKAEDFTTGVDELDEEISSWTSLFNFDKL